MTDQNAGAASQITSNTQVQEQDVLTINGVETTGDTALYNDAELIVKPQAGTEKLVTLEAQQTYKFDFTAAQTQSINTEGETLRITFADGSSIIIENYNEAKYNSPILFGDTNAPTIVSVETPNEDELESAQAVIREEASEIEQAALDQEAAEIAGIEPAAGEAQALNNIQPAAGDTGNQNSGFTFSNPDITPVGALDAVGPIDPTALQYGVEFNNDILFPDEDEGEPEIIDVNPEIVDPDQLVVDETNLGPVTVNGLIQAEFGSDGPGTIEPNGQFNNTGSLSGGTLTSNGVPISVTQTATGYEGSAGGNNIFTIEIAPVTGDYTFTLLGTIDHADGTDPNDSIELQFGVDAIDADGDTAPATISISVLDDAPAIAPTDTNTINEDNLGPIVINDTLTVDFGNDGAGAVEPAGSSSFSGTTSLTSGGQPITITATATGYVGTIAGSATPAFTLNIDPATGAYTFTQNSALDHDLSNDTISLQFDVNVTDYDGDAAPTAIIVNIVDGEPEFATPTVNAGIENIDESNLDTSDITVSGTLNIDFGNDGAGAVTPSNTYSSSGSIAGGTLSSNGQPVTITATANGYVGTINGGTTTVFSLTINPANGTYEFTQFETLDHADTTNPNDVITLEFGVTATDGDGDNDTSTITINIADDGPVAVNDTASVPEKQTTVSGNVLNNDDAGEDLPAALTNIEGNTVTAGTSTVINGTYGILTINADGSYEYTINNTHTGAVSESFTYTLTDFDGDTSTAELTINIEAPDDIPEVDNATATVDETDIDGTAPVGSDQDGGILQADFGSDGPGTFSVDEISTFTFTGAANGQLTSNGVAVTVSVQGNSYVGTIPGIAGDTVVFELSLNQTSGQYTFTQFEALDHADSTNPNDAIQLTFGVVATDNEGDKGNATITVNVLDDGPSIDKPAIAEISEQDTGTSSTPASVSGTLNFGYGEDGAGALTTTGNVSITGTPNLTSGGAAITITATSNGYVGTINGGADTVFSLTINEANGTYTFDQSLPLDHAAGSDEIILGFDVRINDYDQDSANTSIDIKIKDSKPEIATPTVGKGVETVDETNLDTGVSVNGSVDVNFGADQPGTLSYNGVTSSSVPLTSAGQAVTITTTANGYVGTINGGAVTVFTLDIDTTTGDYTFTQLEPLDHPDTTDHNDAIAINFGITATDSDGDTDTASIKINILDDGPSAVNDTATVVENTNVIQGNVLTNDDGGEDVIATVTEITFGTQTLAVTPGAVTTISGQHGTLTIGANGGFTYTSNGTQTSNVSDIFTYTLTDADGDSTTADLTINVADVDYQPDITGSEVSVDETDIDGEAPIGNDSASGTVTASFGGDGPGTITVSGTNTVSFTGAKDGTLTSNGVPIAISVQGNSYIGTIPGVAGDTVIFRLDLNENTGDYTFTLFEQIDHADPTNPNDVIEMTFGVTATDADNDQATTDIIVNIYDDGPRAVADNVIISPDTTTVNGNILANDDSGEDNDAVVTNIRYDGVDYEVTDAAPTVIQSNDGTLTINADGSYEFVSNGTNSTTVIENFQYTMKDTDGDPSTTTLKISIEAPEELLIVGKNVDDVDGQTTPWEIGGGQEEIIGNRAEDILIGDIGGSVEVEQGQDYNFVYILDVSGSMGENNPSDGETSRVELLIAAVKNLINDFDSFQNGNIKAHFVAFSTDTRSTFTVDFTNPNALNDAYAYLDSLQTSGFTNYEAPMQSAIQWLQSGEPIGGNAITQTFFISDGQPNRHLDDNGNVVNPPGNGVEEDQIIYAELSGTNVNIGGQTYGDNTDEIGTLQSFGEVTAVGVNIPNTNNLNVIDTSGTAIYIDDANDIDIVLSGSNPINEMSDVGSDVIQGGGGDDIIYGDSVYTDDLANDQNLDVNPGAGWAVFTKLENGEGNDTSWDREDTINYIRQNADSLARESIDVQGEGREGGDDIISGGAGDDVIYAQEGDDIIIGGEGDDTLTGGSGDDIFVFENITDGVDTITDFTQGEDVLDISGLLQGYDALQDSIDDFVFATESGGNTTISVDVDGAAGPATAVEIAVLEAVTGLNIEDITNNGESSI